MAGRVGWREESDGGKSRLAGRVGWREESAGGNRLAGWSPAVEPHSCAMMDRVAHLVAPYLGNALLHQRVALPDLPPSSTSMKAVIEERSVDVLAWYSGRWPHASDDVLYGLARYGDSKQTEWFLGRTWGSFDVFETKRAAHLGVLYKNIEFLREATGYLDNVMHHAWAFAIRNNDSDFLRECVEEDDEDLVAFDFKGMEADIIAGGCIGLDVISQLWAWDLMDEDDFN